uniref:Prepilin-type N-terminal cleavage/methylation domain-containing protein n=1 Tax=Desulfomonile tiedjei TaxID=2358 RepID=A0A7C4ATE4_9BACT
MKQSGFTLVELLVSIVVVLLIVAGTAAVITYQSRSAVYTTKAVNAQEAVEMALCLIRNDLIQAGGPNGVWWDSRAKRLYIKYNGFLNFEAPATSVEENCLQVRSVFCPADCASNKCGVAWQVVDADGSFSMDRFPVYIGYDIAGLGSAFFGALNVSANDCRTLIGASLLSAVTETAAPNAYVHTLRFVPQGSFQAGSYAAPAIVYELQNNSLRRNGVELLGGDISVTSFTKTDHTNYTTVTVGYTWTPPFSFIFQPISATQDISVNMLQSYLLRIGG